jgi:serine protease inhibitor
MTVDRPFFLAIHDHQTGTILFAGVITNPQAG